MEAKVIDSSAPTDVRSRQPRDKYAFWSKEVDASRKMLRKVHKQGNRIVQRYLDDRGIMGDGEARFGETFRLNLFHSNVLTMENLLYGNLPKVEASRTFADAADDTARVAAEMIERINNLDIQEHGQDYDSVLRSVLQDRLLPGIGVARVRYEVETEMVPDVMGVETEVLSFEDAPVDYYHWQDVLWGWSRSFAEVPWIGFRSYLSKDQVTDEFGKKAAGEVTYKTQKVSDADDQDTLPEQDAPWQKAEIWEIWDRPSGQVVWYSEGVDKLLRRQPDPLGLEGFFPCPPFFLANPTTTLYKPTSDFHLAQDLYNEVDRLQTRISKITEAVKVVGLYNAGDNGGDGITRMFKEGTENDLIPVDNWAMFAEGGGIQGQIDWLPVKDIVETLTTLNGLRDMTIGLLQQTTGMADIMRGELSSPYEGVGQSQLKAQFGSVRIQALQDQFARFVGDLFQLRTEVICKHFDPQTIIQRANMQQSNDAELVPGAVELLKQPNMAHLRIQVRPETVAMEDFARLKSERTEFLNGISTFMQSAAPMLEQQPKAMPYLLKILQWAMSGFKGSSEIEGVLDKAVEGAIAEANQPQQDPGQQEQQAEQAKLQADLQKIQAKAQADNQTRQADLQADMQTAQANHMAKMGEIKATHQARMTEIQAKAMADAQKEQMSLQANLQQTSHTADSETMKDAMEAEMDIEKETIKSGLKIDEIAAASNAKIGEMVTQVAVTPEKSDET